MPPFEFSALTILLAQMGAILLISRLFERGLRRFGQPLVIAEVGAGIALGPSVLGAVQPEAMAALFPPESLPPLKAVSEVGLVLFMFLVGLKLDPGEFRGHIRSAVAISQTSIFAPFALGAGAAWFLRESYAPPGVPFVPFMLFMGAAMSVTAFPVLARILAERGLLTSRIGIVALGCAAVDDVTAWCLLAFVASTARAHGGMEAFWTTAATLAFAAAMLFLVRPALRRVGERFVRPEDVTPVVASAVLLGLIVSAAATEAAGSHALFGAFLFGVVMPKEGALAKAMTEKLETVSVVLFLPLFFAHSGLRTELGLLSEPGDWLAAGALILAATLGKFGGGAVAARLTGFDWRDSSAIGILMNTRGLMQIVVLNLGMDLGVITPTVFTMLVLMALVTTVAASPALRLVYPNLERAR